MFREPGVHGAILTDALASRFLAHVEVTTDWDLARHLGAPRPVIAAAVELNQLLSAGRVGWAPQLREVLGLNKVRKAIGLAAAVGNLAGRAPEEDRQQVTAVLAKHTGTVVRSLAVGKQR
jgi:nitric oxide reductase NorQ protein